MIVAQGARAASQEPCRSRRYWLTIPFAALAMLSITFVSPIAVAATPSASSGTWSIAKTPNVIGALTNSLTSVSCVSQSFCVVVGSHNNGAVSQTLVLTYSAPPPAGAHPHGRPASPPPRGDDRARTGDRLPAL